MPARPVGLLFFVGLQCWGVLAGAAAEMDAKAIETLQEAYGPDYKVVGVRSREVLLNAGNIHCITQQWVKAG